MPGSTSQARPTTWREQWHIEAEVRARRRQTALDALASIVELRDAPLSVHDELFWSADADGDGMLSMVEVESVVGIVCTRIGLRMPQQARLRQLCSACRDAPFPEAGAHDGRATSGDASAQEALNLDQFRLLLKFLLESAEHRIATEVQQAGVVVSSRIARDSR